MLKVILIALLLSACGGHGQDNKQGTAAAEQQQAKETKE